MLGDRPLSFQIKPDEQVRRLIDPLRPAHGIDDSYGRDRYHITVRPLADARHFGPALIDALAAAVTAQTPEPIPICFDRIDGKALRGSRMPAFGRLHAAIEAALTALGVLLPPHRLKPHLSLSYRNGPGARIAIGPIRWLATELLIVESVHGEGRHITRASLPLVPRQLSFGF